MFFRNLSFLIPFYFGIIQKFTCTLVSPLCVYIITPGFRIFKMENFIRKFASNGAKHRKPNFPMKNY